MYENLGMAAISAFLVFAFYKVIQWDREREEYLDKRFKRLEKEAKEKERPNNPY